MLNNTFIGDAAGSLKRPLKGLSCLLGNWHGQFLEGWGLVTAPGYSARCLPIEEMVAVARRSEGRRLLSLEGGNRGVVAPDAVLMWCYGDCKLALGWR